MVASRMPFGKYRDESLEDVPTSYLEWLLRECKNLRPFLRHEVQEELTRRLNGYDDLHDREAGRSYPPPADWSQLITKWYREMAMKYHPDRGGSHQAMVAINDAVERLRELTGAR